MVGIGREASNGEGIPSNLRLSGFRAVATTMSPFSSTTLTSSEPKPELYHLFLAGSYTVAGEFGRWNAYLVPVMRNTRGAIL